MLLSTSIEIQNQVNASATFLNICSKFRMSKSKNTFRKDPQNEVSENETSLMK